MANVLYCHDHIDLARTRGEMIQMHGHHVVVCTTAHASLDRIRRGVSSFDVAIIHKDLGLGKESVDSGKVVDEIRASGPYVRIGIVSGEYPDGQRHVMEMGADFYIPTEDGEWYLEQINREPALPDEILRRGTSVEMPRR